MNLACVYAMCISNIDLCVQQMVYIEKGVERRVQQVGLCCFDPVKGHLCVAATKSYGAFGCMSPRHTHCPT